MISDTINYLRIREGKERAATATATCAAARDVHFQMAERYADELWSLEERLADGADRP